MQFPFVGYAGSKAIKAGDLGISGVSFAGHSITTWRRQDGHWKARSSVSMWSPQTHSTE